MEQIMNQIVDVLPAFPPATLALLVAVWAGWMLWEIVGKQTLFSSRARKRAAAILRGDDTRDDEALSPLERDLRASGFDRGENGALRFRMIQIGLAAAGFLLLSAFNAPPIVALVGAALALWFPQSYVTGRARGRGRKIDEEMPTALTRVGSLINLQPDPVELLAQVASTLLAANPTSLLAGELRTTVAQARTGGAETALKDLEARAPSTALASLAFSLRTYAEAGGSYAHSLIESASRSRAILAGRNRAQAKAAEATTAAKAIPLLLLGVGIFLIQDPMFRDFYTTFAGQVVVAGAAGAMLYGYTLIKSMIQEVG